ncbi:hypothetical protein SCHPADRAFT_995280 [Schizopora paradoxa]|uniref:F-box domain-containing protein n=1 Tax=Schizopora paradoxa TaxID=27342 RepID=A0A0H2SGI4_9AGAM|nr:hypothetical protein SCHPADRAFT_995280 [Schizopora paradoxa]
MGAMDDAFVLAGMPVELDTLELFEVVVNVVNDWRREGHQRIRGRELWAEVSRKDLRFLRLLTPPTNISEAEQTANAVTSVKKIVSFASAIGESLQETLSYLTSVKVQEWGLLALPDELIGTIIELAVYGDRIEIDLSSLQLSHVCRRFRDVALRLPVIWTDLSCRWHGHALVGLYAERSNGLGLNICASDDSLDPKSPHPHDRYKADACARFFQATVAYRDEWRSLFYLGNHSIHLLLRKDLRLPRLEQLRVCSDYIHIFERYEMPIIKSVHFFDVIPQRPLASSLTSFSIMLNKPTGMNMDDCTSLLKFFEATPSIVDLQMRFCCRVQTEDAPVVPVVTLQNVQTFKLDVENPGRSDVHQLVRAIQMPNLSAMDLYVAFEERNQTPPRNSEAFDLLPDPSLHTNLRHLRLTATFISEFWKYHEARYLQETSSDGKLHGFILTLDASQVPFLTTLTLRTHFDFRLTETQLFPLRRLELEKCGRVTRALLKDLRKCLERDNKWEAFEEVVVYDCKRIPKNNKSSKLVGGNMRVLLKAPGKPMGFEGLYRENLSFWKMP